MLRYLLAPLMILVAGTFGGIYAASPAEIFSITGSPPMQAIAVNTLRPANSHTRFSGTAELQLADSSPLALVTNLAVKKSKRLYAFKSTQSGFPKIKGKLTTFGEPPSVRSAALTLTRGTGDVVKVAVASSVMVMTLPGSPFIGEFTGSFAGRGVSGPFFLVIGANGKAAAWVELSGAFDGGASGVADFVTGAVKLNQLSTQLTGPLTFAVQLQASGSSVTGNGTFAVVSHKSTNRGTLRITAQEGVASDYVGAYLGTLTITGGPDAPNSWPIQLAVANDGSAGGTTFDPDGNGFLFQGTANLTSGALALAVREGKRSLSGITGSLTGNFVTPSMANGSFTLSNGDTGTVSFPRVAP